MEYKLEELNNALSDKETSNSEDLINQLNQLLLEKNNLQKKNAQIQSTMNDIQTENKLLQENTIENDVKAAQLRVLFKNVKDERDGLKAKHSDMLVHQDQCNTTLKNNVTKINVYKKQIENCQKESTKAENALKEFRQKSVLHQTSEKKMRDECTTRLEKAMEAITLFEHKVKSQKNTFDQEKLQWTTEKTRMTNALEEHGQQFHSEKINLSNKMLQLEKDTILREKKVEELEHLIVDQNTKLKHLENENTNVETKLQVQMMEYDKKRKTETNAVLKQTKTTHLTEIQCLQTQHLAVLSQKDETLLSITKQRDSTLHLCTELKHKIDITNDSNTTTIQKNELRMQQQIKDVTQKFQNEKSIFNDEKVALQEKNQVLMLNVQKVQDNNQTMQESNNGLRQEKTQWENDKQNISIKIIQASEQLEGSF